MHFPHIPDTSHLMIDITAQSKKKAPFSESHLQLQSISQRGRHLSRTEGVRSGGCCPLLAGKISYTDDEILSNANGKTEASHPRASESGQKAAGRHSHSAD